MPPDSQNADAPLHEQRGAEKQCEVKSPDDVSTLAAALAYAARGWRVHPLRPLSKLPLLTGWPDKATTDPDTIRRWWRDHPKAGIGIATGRGLLVLDVDAKGEVDGHATLADLVREHGGLARTYTVTTPTGGQHLYLATGADLRNTAGALGPGLDTRADGGYVVAPPTMVDAGRYAIAQDGDLAPAPGWLLNLLQAPKAPASHINGAIPEGRRNDRLFREACRLRRDGADADAIHHHLREIPTDPPLPDAELRQIAASACRHEPEPMRQARAIWTPDARDRFDLSELESDPPRIRFAVHPYLPSGTAAALTAAGGTNKTGLMVSAAVSICIGAPALGDDEIEPGAVLIVSAEDRRDILQRHVWAATQGLPHLALRAVSEHLHVKDAVGSGFTLTVGVAGTLQIAAEVADLAAYAKTIPNLRLICLDTLSRLNGGDEMNESLATFIRAMERVAVATGAAVLVAHHTGKAQMREGANDQYSGRGGSALSDNARSVLHLEVVKDGPGAPSNAGSLIEEGRLLRLSHVKSNYAERAPDRYFERVRTPFAARLVPFEADMRPKTAEPVSKCWAIVADWLRNQSTHEHPTKAVIEAELRGQVTRADLRLALAWAEDSGLVEQPPHPKPIAGRKTFYRLPEMGE